MSVQIMFTFRDLERQSGRDRREIRTLFRSNGVILHKCGNRDIVFRPSIEARIPEFLDALRYRNGGDED